jgi:hypothetical protein
MMELLSQHIGQHALQTVNITATFYVLQEQNITPRCASHTSGNVRESRCAACGTGRQVVVMQCPAARPSAPGSSPPEPLPATLVALLSWHQPLAPGVHGRACGRAPDVSKKGRQGSGQGAGGSTDHLLACFICCPTSTNGSVILQECTVPHKALLHGAVISG